MRMLFRQIFFLCLLALVPALVSAAVQLKWKPDVPLQPGEVRAATVRQWESVVWVDARPTERFKAGHIGDAVSLPSAHWGEELPGLFAVWTADKTLVVYSEDENDTATSMEVAARLRSDLKMDGVYVLKGGLKAWQP